MTDTHTNIVRQIGEATRLRDLAYDDSEISEWLQLVDVAGALGARERDMPAQSDEGALFKLQQIFDAANEDGHSIGGDHEALKLARVVKRVMTAVRAGKLTSRHLAQMRAHRPIAVRIDLATNSTLAEDFGPALAWFERPRIVWDAATSTTGGGRSPT